MLRESNPHAPEDITVFKTDKRAYASIQGCLGLRNTLVRQLYA
jgi:hypothetical protein